MSNKKIIIIGGGPAGLSAAYELLSADNNVEVQIIEQDEKIGGLSKTIFDENGNGTDIGPHRFFSKNDEVMQLWNRLLLPQGAPAADDIFLKRNFKAITNGLNPETDNKVLLKRKRFSRIYYKKKFIDYPLKLNLSSIFSIGLVKILVTGLSYLKSCLHKIKDENLETFLINRFGRVLYEMFFENYTQKVWGVHPSKISKIWGEQRIKGLSPLKIIVDILSSIFKFKNKKEISLIDEYYYPKYGSSQLWEIMADEIKQKGGKILLNNKVTELVKSDNKIVSIKTVNTKTGEISDLTGDIIISSMPIKDMITNMNGDVPENIYNIANSLAYRDYILVNYISSTFNLKNNTNYPTIKNIAPDSWIYLQDTGLQAGRLDIMNNFSPYIIDNFKENIVFNLEYFCNENDEFWNKSDEYIIDFGITELKKLNVVEKQDIKNAKVIRIKKAYPSYTGGYTDFYKIKDYINSFDNLYCIGRNGQHKYNNMDHSVLSGIVVSRVILQNLDKNILWEVNTESEYQEIKK